MDKIAIISDIHGNVPALEAVLEDIRNRGVEKIFCLGDIIGKGPGSCKTLDICREVCDVILQGNWDDYISKHDKPGTVGWYRKQLGEKRLKYLRSLPYVIDFYLSGKLVRLFHAHPGDVFTRIFPHSSKEERLSMFNVPELPGVNLQAKEADIAGYGDIHSAFMQYINDKLLFNTGSVGNPLDVTMASYVILEGKYGSKINDHFAIQFFRVQYQIDQAIEQARAVELPNREAFIRELKTGIYRGINK